VNLWWFEVNLRWFSYLAYFSNPNGSGFVGITNWWLS
jgi:hypothetical protein